MGGRPLYIATSKKIYITTSLPVSAFHRKGLWHLLWTAGLLHAVRPTCGLQNRLGQHGAASALQTDIALRSWVPLLERSSRSFGRLVGLEVAYPPIAKGLSLQVVPTLNHLQIFGSVLFLIVVAFNLIMLKQYIVYHI